MKKKQIEDDLMNNEFLKLEIKKFEDIKKKDKSVNKNLRQSDKL
jgi:hypothetical protein